MTGEGVIWQMLPESKWWHLVDVLVVAVVIVVVVVLLLQVAQHLVSK